MHLVLSPLCRRAAIAATGAHGAHVTQQTGGAAVPFGPRRGRILVVAGASDAAVTCAVKRMPVASLLLAEHRWNHAPPLGCSRGFATEATARERQDRRRPSRASPRKSIDPPRHDTPSESPSWSQAVGEFEYALSLEGPKDESSATKLHSLVLLCTEAERHRAAESAVVRAKKAGVPVFPQTTAIICGGLLKQGRSEKALSEIRELVASLPSNPDNADLYRRILLEAKKTNDWRSIRLIIQQMHELKIAPPMHAFRKLVVALGNSREKGVLLQTIDFLRTKFGGEELDLATLGSMCYALNEVGECGQVLKIYDNLSVAQLLELDDRVKAPGGEVIVPQFLKAAIDGNDLNKASTIFYRFVAAPHCAPNSHAFGVYATALESKKRWSEIIEIANLAQDRHVRTGGTTSFFDTITCAKVIRALHNQPDLPKRDLERSMTGILKRIPTMERINFGHTANLIAILEEYGYLREALELFKLSGATNWDKKAEFTLNLHGHNKSTAKCAIVLAFQGIREQYRWQQGRGLGDLRIISGVGKHSKVFMQPVLPTEVGDLLQTFRPPIRSVPHKKNPGVLIVPERAIRHWLKGTAVIPRYD